MILGFQVLVGLELVFEKVTESRAAAAVAATAALLFYYGLWFGYTTYRRARNAH